MKVLRNILNLSLVLPFLMASGGTGMYLHYCDMQNITQTSLASVQSCCIEEYEWSSDDCCNDGHGKTGFSNDRVADCCSTDFQYFKIQDEFQPSREEKTHVPVIIINDQSLLGGLDLQTHSHNEEILKDPFPPGQYTLPFFIQLSHLRL